MSEDKTQKTPDEMMEDFIKADPSTVTMPTPVYNTLVNSASGVIPFAQFAQINKWLGTYAEKKETVEVKKKK